ncbi:hypothetical protein Q5P01_004311 [Channa striata]|uniref:Uncharacterized protein n=1 Tax=Channa striata TaxID=64152 RepID=A0AA88NLD3_CHASR|nr:hypothetical protein Q5P01_004311 [Channa striata]
MTGQPAVKPSEASGRTLSRTKCFMEENKATATVTEKRTHHDGHHGGPITEAAHNRTNQEKTANSAISL